MRAPALRVTLAGRNLATFTGYSGPDPEVNGYGQRPFATADYFTQPQVRTLVLRLDVGR